MPFLSNDRQELPAGPFPPAWQSYLDKNVFVYQLLTETECERLRDAIRIFIARKFWEGRAGFQVTDEVKVTIASQACSLILGFEDY